MLALLHTSPLHIPVFEALRDEHHQGLELRHFVAEDLLTRAGTDGPDSVTDDVRALLDRAVAEGATTILCTCSSIGGVAEAADPGVPVLRVDRPMAAAAVATGPRIVVLATVHSTLAPTVALIEEEATGPVEIRTVLLDEAWPLFRAGDTEGYARAVATAVDAITDADAIVLAQASLTPAQRLTTTAIPVLSSPRPGLAAAAEVARATG
ncbi:arylsulfatase [Streptomyces sp. NPDC002643]